MWKAFEILGCIQVAIMSVTKIIQEVLTMQYSGSLADSVVTSPEWWFSHNLTFVKENQNQTEVKEVKTVFHSGTIAIEEKRPHYRTGLSSQYNRNKWRFIAKERIGRVEGWKITKRRPQGWGDSC